MDAMTPPNPEPPTERTTLFPDLVTRIGIKGSYSHGADFAALIGGGVSVVLLLFICTIAVLLWCLSRQKGSYETNETDEDAAEDAEDAEDGSVGSDTALRSKEALRSEEED